MPEVVMTFDPPHQPDSPAGQALADHLAPSMTEKEAIAAQLVARAREHTKQDRDSLTR